MEPTLEPIEQPVSPEIQTPPLSKRVLVIRVVAIAVVLIVLGIGAYVAVQMRGSSPIVSVPIEVPTGVRPPREISTGDENYIPYDAAIAATELVRVQALLAKEPFPVSSDRYGIFMETYVDPEYPSHLGEYISYFEDGIIPSGKYAGYHLVIAEYPSDGPELPSYYTFATKDYKTFVLHDDKLGLVPNPGFVNPKVVTGVDALPVHFPAIIPINDVFTLSLVRQFSTTTASFGRQIQSELVSGLSLYTLKIDVEDIVPDEEFNMSEIPPVGIDFATYTKTLRDAIGESTILVAQDSAGNSFAYHLSFKGFESYLLPTATKPATPDGYQDSYSELEVSPGNSVPSMYATYGNIFPLGCGTTNSSWSYTVKNILESDLVDTGRSWKGAELYTFAPGKGTSLIQTEHYLKQTYDAYSYVSDTFTPEGTRVIADPIRVPTEYEKYAQQNPIMFFKDPWGRWVGIAEHTYLGGGGCGKPVVYLYPETPTKVTLSFPRLPSFHVDIPSYHNGWNVLAHPDGSLTDLQSEYTDCAALDTNRIGSEYAKDACKTKTYPYIYWSGHANGTYPIEKKGFVVTRDELDTVMSTELNKIGLTAKESDDMRSFWVPKLLETKSPFYRLSFFTTEQMNRFIPMTVSPRPQSTLRVFLDWSPLSEKPSSLPEPQSFKPFARSGFTLVEWGGLER
ncbi:MAG: hypothetical protein AB203_04020 [Parcubacteria bacterium C7867-008]|nr:MAG: hypothetical protein AB203_04020 [Parcubacteria bacterium C7867-008]